MSIYWSWEYSSITDNFDGKVCIKNRYLILIYRQTIRVEKETFNPKFLDDKS